MINSDDELYERILHIISVLKLHGEIQRADNLKEAMDISSLPGEVLGELRLRLLPLQGVRIITKLGIDAEIVESLKYLNGIL